MQLGPRPRVWDKGPEGEGQEHQKENSRGSLGRVMAVVMGVMVKVARTLEQPKQLLERRYPRDMGTNQVVWQVPQGLRWATSEGA